MSVQPPTRNLEAGEVVLWDVGNCLGVASQLDRRASSRDFAEFMDDFVWMVRAGRAAGEGGVLRRGVGDGRGGMKGGWGGGWLFFVSVSLVGHSAA